MFKEIVGFEWDDGNLVKCQKHGVSIDEIEALFVSDSMSVLDDAAHSFDERRFLAIGRTGEDRHIFLGFTLRERSGQSFIRVITARYMHQKEIDHYAEKNSGS